MRRRGERTRHVPSILALLLIVPTAAGQSAPPVASATPQPLVDLAPLPVGLYDLGAATDGTDLFVFGGNADGSVSDRIYRYDVAQNTWSVANARLPGGAAGPMPVHDGRYFYLFNSDGNAANILRYDPTSDTLLTLDARLPSARFHGATVWTGSDVLVFGGRGGSHGGKTYFDEIFRFRPSDGTVESVGRLTTPLADTTAFWDHDRAIVFGGNEADATPVDRWTEYVPAVGTRTRGPLPQPVEGAASAFDGQNAWIFDAHPNVLRFDAATDDIYDTGVALPRAGRAAAVWLDGYAYRIGGAEAGASARLVRFDPAGASAVSGAPWTQRPAEQGVAPSRPLDAQLRLEATGRTVHADARATSGGRAPYTFEIDWGDGSARAIGDTQQTHTYPGRTASPPSGARPAVEAVASLPVATGAASAVTDGSRIYVFGGETSDGPTRTIWTYDPASDAWTTAGARLPAFASHTSAVWTGTRAVVFGVGGDGIVTYDPVSDVAEQVARMPNATRGTAAAWDGTHAWVFGGDAGSGATRQILRFDPATASVETMRVGLLHPVSGGVAVWTGQDVVIASGQPSRAAYEDLRGMTFDPRTLQLAEAGGFNPAEGVGGFYHDGLVYTVAGKVGRFGYDTGFQRVEIPYGGSTVPDTRLPGPGRAYAPAVLLGDDVYVIGGLGQTGPTASVARAHPPSFPGYAPPAAGPHDGPRGYCVTLVVRDADGASASFRAVAHVDGHAGDVPGCREGPVAAAQPAPGDPAQQPPTAESTPQPATPRDPCYELLSCPLGDPTAVLAKLKGASSRVESAAGQALAGAPVFLLTAEDGVLKPAAATLTDASGRFRAPDTLDKAPAYVAALVGGHIVMQQVAASEARIAAGLGLDLPIPDDLVDHALARGMGPTDLARLQTSFQDAKPHHVGNLTADVETSVATSGYAGVREVAFTPAVAGTNAQLVLVRLHDKGTDRIPDPPVGSPRAWFAAQVIDAEGSEVPVRSIRFRFEASYEGNVVVNHFRLRDSRWETLQPQREEDGSYSVQSDSLSLFAVSEVKTSAFAAVVQTVAGSRFTLPLAAVAVFVAVAALAYVRLKPRISLRTRDADAPPPPDAGSLPLVPAGSAGLARVELPDAEFLVSGVSLQAGGKAILRDVSFGFQKGQILALLGPSGCGKSTTLKCITGETRPAGEISIFGLDPLRQRDAITRVVGYVSQDTQLYPEMTVRENVEYFAKQYGLKAKDLKETVPSLLAVLGLADRAGERVHVLSGGQQRRASIAATLVHSPAVLILDEPTSGLDPITRRNLWKFIKQANRDLGVSVIVTTHFLDEAEFADRVVIMNRGRVVASGTPAELVAALPGGGKAVVVELNSTTASIEARIRDAVARLEGEGVVKKMEMSGFVARFFVPDPQLASRRLFETFNDLGVPIKKITTEDCGMDDVFAHHAGETWKETSE